MGTGGQARGNVPRVAVAQDTPLQGEGCVAKSIAGDCGLRVDFDGRRRLRDGPEFVDDAASAEQRGGVVHRLRHLYNGLLQKRQGK
jgi:hypothetical protein